MELEIINDYIYINKLMYFSLNYPTQPINYPIRAFNHPIQPINYPIRAVNYPNQPINYPKQDQWLKLKSNFHRSKLCRSINTGTIILCK